MSPIEEEDEDGEFANSGSDSDSKLPRRGPETGRKTFYIDTEVIPTTPNKLTLNDPHTFAWPIHHVYMIILCTYTSRRSGAGGFNGTSLLAS